MTTSPGEPCAHMVKRYGAPDPATGLCEGVCGVCGAAVAPRQGRYAPDYRDAVAAAASEPRRPRVERSRRVVFPLVHRPGTARY